MTTLKVKVKWGKEAYDVELDLKEDPEVFKAQLFALTGVTPDRQKVSEYSRWIFHSDSAGANFPPPS